MTGKVRIAYAVIKERASGEVLRYRASLMWGDGWKSFLYAEGDSKESARAQVITAFREIPNPEEWEIKPEEDVEIT